MKSIEIFLDESGSMGFGQPPMNVTGVVLISPDDLASARFHAAFYAEASKKFLLAGLCDNDKRRPGMLNPPARYIEKRPSPRASEKVWQAHMHSISELVAIAKEVAKTEGVEIGAFSLVFQATSGKPWFAPEDWENELLDRSYLERIKDVLELLFFEAPWVRGTLANPCRLSLDLPTRSIDAKTPKGASVEQLGNNFWVRWGLKNDGQGQGQLRVSSLAASDAAEILTSILNRRKLGFPKRCVQVGRCRCVRLMDWAQWKRDFWRSDQRNRFFQTSIAPVHIHYLADFLANAIYQGSALLENPTIAEWFRRGFFLNAAKEKIDPWILACRLFANGDRAGALHLLHRKGASLAGQTTAGFFGMRSRDWFEKLSGEDLCVLFREVKPLPVVESAPAPKIRVKPGHEQPGLLEEPALRQQANVPSRSAK